MTFSNIAWKAPGSIVTKVYIESSEAEQTKICSNIPGHMTNMETMLVDSKNLWKSRRTLFFCLGGQDHPLIFNQFLSYFDSFKLSSLFKRWVWPLASLLRWAIQGLMALLFFPLRAHLVYWIEDIGQICATLGSERRPLTKSVHMQYCNVAPLALASAEICFQTESEWARWSPRTRKYIQSTLLISKSKGPSKTVRDIRTSTYQICSIEEKTIWTTKFDKWLCNLTPLIRNIYWKYRGKGEKLLFFTIFYNLILDFCVITRTRSFLRDKRLFEITEVEIMRVDCNMHCDQQRETLAAYILG